MMIWLSFSVADRYWHDLFKIVQQHNVMPGGVINLDNMTEREKNLR